MRQSLGQLERSFEQEAATERVRRRHLKKEAVERTRVRRRAKIEKRQQLRFIVLLISILLTVVVVTVVMFETLSWLMG
jgi:uncharacterized membrane protein